MNIEEYGCDRVDLVVVTAVNAYLKNLTPEARRTTLAEVVKRNGAETVIDAEKLTTLIENAKAAAMISAGAWQNGEGDYQKAIDFIRETLPAVDAKKYATDERFLRFIEDSAE